MSAGFGGPVMGARRVTKPQGKQVMEHISHKNVRVHIRVIGVEPLNGLPWAERRPVATVGAIR